MKATNFNMVCLVIIATILFMATLFPGGAHAQVVPGECHETEAPYIYMADVTYKTVGVAGLRNETKVIEDLKDSGTCETIKKLEAARVLIPGDETLNIKDQTIKTTGQCYPQYVCPNNQE